MVTSILPTHPLAGSKERPTQARSLEAWQNESGSTEAAKIIGFTLIRTIPRIAANLLISTDASLTKTVDMNLGDNRLLATLPIDVIERLRPEMELVAMPLGKVIYESGTELKEVYFPVRGCIVSMLYVMADGSSAEIAVVGDEGMVGIALFMGGGTTPSRAIVQSAGRALQLKGSALLREFERHSELKTLLLRFTQALITQMSQTAVCNRHHNVEKQLCRWLLLSLDRLSTHELTMTQELIANMLGVRREGVTDAAGKLQARGWILYSRGRIKVLDRPGLEAQVCECYAVVKKEYDRLLPAKTIAATTPPRATTTYTQIVEPT
ncbi:MAG TPA: Crp/Fnr family transcriptional regulator [Steroidobacteraceae bacterium]|nr:Crp/Fnr family transcriptional regulator [Steroidobacteraceae bacterium]